METCETWDSAKTYNTIELKPIEGSQLPHLLHRNSLFPHAYGQNSWVSSSLVDSLQFCSKTCCHLLSVSSHFHVLRLVDPSAANASILFPVFCCSPSLLSPSLWLCFILPTLILGPACFLQPHIHCLVCLLAVNVQFYAHCLETLPYSLPSRQSSSLSCCHFLLKLMCQYSIRNCHTLWLCHFCLYIFNSCLRLFTCVLQIILSCHHTCQAFLLGRCHLFLCQAISLFYLLHQFGFPLGFLYSTPSYIPPLIPLAFPVTCHIPMRFLYCCRPTN